MNGDRLAHSRDANAALRSSWWWMLPKRRRVQTSRVLIWCERGTLRARPDS